MDNWEAYFKEYEGATLASHGWGWEDLNIETMYQMFKARFMDEAATSLAQHFGRD